MLSRLRHLFVDSWFGRILIGLIFIVFVGWGVSDIFMNIWNNGFNNDPNVVAKIGSRKISLTELDTATQKELAQFARQQGFSDPTQIPAVVKSALVNQALQNLAIQNIWIQKSHDLGIEVPDSAVRDAVWSLPDFQVDGKFNRDKLNALLKGNNISEKNFLNMIRDQLSITNMLDPIEGGVRAPDMMIKPFFQFYNQTRSLSYIFVPYNHFPFAPAPDETILKRYYDNHLWEFKIPEYRRVKLIILSPETIAKDIEISDQVFHQYYEAEKNKFVKGEARDFQIVTFPDQHTAQLLANTWRAHANWQQMQDFAQKNKGTALEMSDLQKSAIPLPELAQAVFTTEVNQITEPFKTMTGWSVVKVTRIIPGQHIDFEAAKPQLRLQIAKDQAGQVLGSRVSRLQDILAGGNGLDKIDANLGVAAIEGTLDEQGLTKEGENAPIPVEGKLRQDMLTKIFSTAKNAQPVLIAGENNTYYAFIVEDILPAHEAAYDQAKNKVVKAWQKADIYRQANIAATALYKDALTENKQLQTVKSDFPVKISSAFSRGKPVKDLPASLQNQAFTMKIGEVTMVEAPHGFIVASLTSIKTPEAKDDPEGYQHIKDVLTQSLQSDSEMSYATSLQKNTKISINQKALDALMNQLNH